MHFNYWCDPGDVNIYANDILLYKPVHSVTDYQQYQSDINTVNMAQAPTFEYQSSEMQIHGSDT